MAPNEELDEKGKENLEEEESPEEVEEEIEEEVENEDEEDVLDVEKERDRLRFHYRGHTLDDLKKMNMDQLLQLLPSRARRTLRRGLPPRQKKVIERLRRAYRAKKRGKDLVVRTHVRDLVIFPEFVGLKVGIYNGRTYEIVEVRPEMIGHYLGEFAITRRRVQHGSPGIGATRSSKYVPLK
jgi:small subunit ribosomal protein S19